MEAKEDRISPLVRSRISGGACLGTTMGRDRMDRVLLWLGRRWVELLEPMGRLLPGRKKVTEIIEPGKPGLEESTFPLLQPLHHSNFPLYPPLPPSPTMKRPLVKLVLLREDWAGVISTLLLRPPPPNSAPLLPSSFPRLTNLSR